MRRVFVALALLVSWFATSQDKVGTVDLKQESFTAFEVFADSLDKYSVYFTGENHQFTTFNTKFQFKLLKYLHSTQGVRHFVFEQGPGLAYIINEIILKDKTTHMHYLRDVFFEPFYDLVKSLRKFNDGKPEEDKITVHGIDVERFPSFSVYALKEIVDTADKTVEGGEIFEQIKALASSQYNVSSPATFYQDPSENFNFQFGEISPAISLQSIINTANANEQSLKKALQKDSTVFFSIIKSLEVGKEWYLTEKQGDVKSPIIRERFMSDEFEKVYRADPSGKFYGQFGRCHLHKDQNAGRCYDYYMNSIANRINEIDRSLKNKVLVIPIFYQKTKDFDQNVIKSLNLDEKYTSGEETYIIDLAYTKGDNPIVGFYNNLPFVIISNASKDLFDSQYDWEEELFAFHLGFDMGYWYFNRLSNLNTALAANGAQPFDQRTLAYTFYMDFFEMFEQGASVIFNYYPEVSNGGRFNMRGWNVGTGSSYPMGNRYLMIAPGLNMTFGNMKLFEEELSAEPNLIQQDGKNIVQYKNDVFLLDPNLQMRITLPVISLNLRTGYAFDVSGKYWRLDGKMKNFTKTSFSAPYIQVGASLNFKSN